MKSDIPLISIIIPVFNIAEYLPQCLESLMAQSFRDFEVLCVDDASSDQSAEVVGKYQKQDHRVKLLQQEHAGVSAARNLGIRHARGTYFVFFDGDDWAEPDMLSSLVSAAEGSHADMAVCSAYVECDCADKGVQRRVKALQRDLTVTKMLWEAEEDPQGIWKALEMPGSWPFVWNKLIRGDLIRENGLFFSEQVQLGEDGLFLQVLFQYARRITFIEPALYHYRYQRQASATVRLFQERQIRFFQHVRILENLSGELHRRNKLEASGADLLHWTVQFLYHDFVQLPAQQQPEASGIIRSALADCDLVRCREQLDPVFRKRLDLLCNTASVPTKSGRIYRILRMKIENRVRKLLSRNA